MMNLNSQKIFNYFGGIGIKIFKYMRGGYYTIPDCSNFLSSLVIVQSICSHHQSLVISDYENRQIHRINFDAFLKKIEKDIIEITHQS